MTAPPDSPPHVRAAAPPDAALIAAVQTRAWRASYTGVASEVSAAEAQPIADAWATAIKNPPTPAHAVFVAVTDGLVIGFAACDDTGEIVALEVDPAHRRAGHGSRLLAALADHARAHALEALGVWCPVPDEPRRAFFQSAGFVPDKGLRSLESRDGCTLDEAHLIARVEPR